MAADRVQVMTELSGVLVSYLRTLPCEHQGGFTQNFMDNAQRYVSGRMDERQFRAVFGELKRDIKGTGAAIRAQSGRTSSGHRVSA